MQIFSRAGARVRAAPRLITYFAIHALVGALIGIALGAALLMMDIAGIGTAFAQTDMKIIAGFVHFGSFALTLSACVTGTSVMFLTEDDR